MRYLRAGVVATIQLLWPQSDEVWIADKDDDHPHFICM